jgi:hypothetical protein
MNKKYFQATSLRDSEDYKFWKDKTYLQRLGALEFLRRTIFNYDPSSERLQRVFTITELKKN